MTTVLVDLDDRAALDPSVTGAKAARLAAARRLGLPALPGTVVPVPVARAAAAGAATEALARGSGAARLAIMRAPVDPGLLKRLRARAADLGYPVIARSSSPLEDDPAWSGAFSSLQDVHDADLATALRGCWASAFAVDPLQRAQRAGVAPVDMAVAVLVQPQIDPDAGGLARVQAGDVVEITAVKGSPAPLLAGWQRGTRIAVDTSDGVRVTGPDDGPVTAPVAVAVAHLARDVVARMGSDVIEWAVTGSRVVLLQARSAAAPAAVTAPAPDGLDHPMALRLARLATRHPGPADDRLVLSWACAPGWRDPGGHPVTAKPNAVVEGIQADGLPPAAARLASRLASLAWGLPASRALDAAARTLAEVRGPAPAAALARLAALNEVPAEPATRLLRMVHAAAGPRGGNAARNGWEPFIYGAVRAHGQHIAGAPAAPGIGAGLVLPITNPHDADVAVRRPVLAAPWPLPGLAPLLWGAAGLVTGAGSAAAHLLEVAHSLRVPAVVGCPLEQWLDGAGHGPVLAAVDGDAGAVFVTTG